VVQDHVHINGHPWGGSQPPSSPLSRAITGHHDLTRQKLCQPKAFGAVAFNSTYLAHIAPETVSKILGNKGYTFGKKVPTLSNRIPTANWKRPF